MTTRPEYGSREYYSEMFSDIICDTGCYETVEENYETVMKIMGGFQDDICRAPAGALQISMASLFLQYSLRLGGKN